ncbi:hypothetical protein SAMN05216564_1206 [Halopenitus persicus]|uniref:Uncharacterized protein n=1 Tax=Halopenitus persicus TaxID=1048396 RepID=A0A1H3P627_9EURY|nr:hypothetical protein SAMN05216564_1206 [Halopenitus persicus]
MGNLQKQWKISSKILAICDINVLFYWLLH